MRIAGLFLVLLLLPHVVSGQEPSQTSLVITPDETRQGEPVTLFATVAAADEVPAGEVTFTDRTIPIGTEMLAPRATGHGQIASGRAHTCVIGMDGVVACWGLGTWGQLGNGGNDRQPSPVRAEGIDDPVTQIAAGYHHTCALTLAGAVWCWGYNDFGQLGTGDQNDRNLPSPVAGLPAPVAQIGANGYFTCAVTLEGDLYCWGQNFYGQIGNGNTEHQPVPVRVTTLPGSAALVAQGQTHTCAVLRNTRVFCWGRNTLGQLGDGSGEDSLVPVPVIGGRNAALLASGGNHSCMVRTNGTVRCWGYNRYGQLGDGTDVNRLAPVRNFAAGRDVSDLALNDEHGCSVFRQSRVRCWGRNVLGQLGDDTFDDSWTGVEPHLPRSSFWAVSTYVDGSCAQGTGGVVHCWGRNDEGQAGVGSAGGIFREPQLVQGGAVIAWWRLAAFAWHRIPGGLTPRLHRFRAEYAGSETLAPSRSPRIEHRTYP
ncbi:MAG: hypothetical protein KDK12_08780 [Rhodobacteraceae bacterium]|nr:hypothetical protein [Paracoccaceae bacterium]